MTDLSLDDKWFTRKWRPGHLISLPGEEWRDVRGFEGLYRVSSMGRVWSTPRISATGDRRVGGRIIRGTEWMGLRILQLRTAEGTTVALPLAVLVMEAFLDIPYWPEFRDGDTTNCALENLDVSRLKPYR